MRANHKYDTEPELLLRRKLHVLGLRYSLRHRIETSPPVIPDVVFPRLKIALFVDGCFWHGCPDHGCQPRTNASYWSRKISLNKNRDRIVDQNLTAIGWRPIRVWEHDNPERAAWRVRAIVRSTINNEQTN
jgi:DNA mismatch endonuclease (patch repair protein)